MLTPDIILRAYQHGLFPMAQSRDSQQVIWVEPEQRGVLPLDQFHIPRSLKKTIRKGIYTTTINEDFRSVIKACGAITNNRQDTWINREIADAYTELHEMGYAHSVETWIEDKKGRQLVGGLYGVAIGSAFFGESMFTRANDASKVAFVRLVEQLKKQDFRLLDTQFLNNHLARFGTIEVPAEAFHILLADALRKRAIFN